MIPVDIIAQFSASKTSCDILALLFWIKFGVIKDKLNFELAKKDKEITVKIKSGIEFNNDKLNFGKI